MSDVLEPFAEPVRFDELVALLPELEAGTGAGRLYEVAHRGGCIFKFDWAKYTHAARRYFEPGELERADLETCRKLLTIIVRQERFVENSLSEHVESGFVARLVRRIAELTKGPIDA